MSGFGFPTSPLASSSGGLTHTFGVPQPASPQHRATGRFSSVGIHPSSPVGAQAGGFPASPPAMPQFALSPVGSPTGVHSPQQHQQQHSPLAAVQFGGRGGSAAAATREQYTSFVLGDAPKQWYITFRHDQIKLGAKKLSTDPCLFAFYADGDGK